MLKGGQNPLEAARFGAKIIHGPNIDNFKDVYKLLKTLNVSKKLNQVKNLLRLSHLKGNTKIGGKIKFIGKNILKKTINELDSIIENEIKKNLNFGIIKTKFVCNCIKSTSIILQLLNSFKRKLTNKT